MAPWGVGSLKALKVAIIMGILMVLAAVKCDARVVILALFVSEIDLLAIFEVKDIYFGQAIKLGLVEDLFDQDL